MVYNVIMTVKAAPEEETASNAVLAPAE
jgi:hypothetical protein